MHIYLHIVASKKKKITSTKISGEVNEDASQSGALSNFQSESDEEPESSSVDSSSDDESDENSSMQKENICVFKIDIRSFQLHFVCLAYTQKFSGLASN